MPNWFTRWLWPNNEEETRAADFTPPGEAPPSSNAQQQVIPLTEQAALGIPAMYRALDIISGKAASTERQVVRETRGGTRTVLYDHAVYVCLNEAPNDLYPAHFFISNLLWNADFHGNGLAAIGQRYDDRGEPRLKMYLLDPATTTLRYANGRWSYQAQVHITEAGDILSGSLAASYGLDAKPKNFPMSEVFHLRSGIGNGMVGYPLLALFKDALQEQVAIGMYSASAWANGCQFKTVWELPPGFDYNKPEKMANYRAMTEGVHKGPRNANRNAYTAPGTKVYTLGVNNEQIQWALARKEISPMVVSQLTGVPVHMLGDPTGTSQYKSQTDKRQDFYDFTMGSWFDRFSAEARMKLFETTERDLYCEFNRQQLIRHDVEVLDKIAQSRFTSGRATLNELLADENKPGIGEDGDVRFMPANLVPMDKLINPPEPPPAPAPIAPKPDQDTESGDENAPGASLDQAKDAAVKRSMNRLKKSIEARSGKPTFAKWLEQDFAEYHRAVLVEALEPFSRDADVIIDSLLADMASEFAACLPEQRDYTKYEERLHHELRN